MINNLDDFKVGDLIKITNLETNQFKQGIILEFDKNILKLLCKPDDYTLKILYKKKFLKIERIFEDV